MTISKNFVAAIILAVGVFCLVALIWPKYQYMQSVKSAFEQRSTFLADSQAALDNMHVIDGEYESNKAKYERMLVFMPSQKRSDYVTSSIQNAVTQSGLQMSSITVTEGASKKQGAEYQEIPVSLEITGRYTDILRFFGILEQSLRLYDIIQIDLKKASTGGFGRIDGTVRLMTYSLK